MINTSKEREVNIMDGQYKEIIVDMWSEMMTALGHKEWYEGEEDWNGMEDIIAGFLPLEAQEKVYDFFTELFESL